MRDLDETDLEILQLLMSNARRPYSDIADIVGLSAPAVSDRVARLQEMGIINRFTLDVDGSQLRKGIPCC
ncbi:Lrp/AsnC family transcriptional regulator [Haloarcula amylovorans]|uniref:Lrp/AsnC family transcriptional regulator n=1 Tax=Haloarcula amylovorans TaxID=2562280 RepID=UPI001FD81DC6|nr:Lrp/AsnC family transcriptional regulator [Halomicroarcula amylolytica]